MFDLAKENLNDNISFVGIHERFDESFFLLLYFLDVLELLEDERKNTSRVKRSVREMTADDGIAVNRFNQYDLELYAYARELYASKHADVKMALRKPRSYYLMEIGRTQTI